MKPSTSPAVITALVLTLSGHALATEEPALYLRCDCNWWKAEEAYRLENTGRDRVYRTRMVLDAVGLPISFKLVDEAFTAGSNFGYLREQDKQIRLGQVAKARDAAVRENFEFNPQQPGIYQFYLDLSGPTPLVFVLRE